MSLLRPTEVWFRDYVQGPESATRIQRLAASPAQTLEVTDRGVVVKSKSGKTRLYPWPVISWVDYA